MLKLIGQRLLQMGLIVLVVSLVLFFVFDSDKFKKQLAVNELGGFAIASLTQSDYENWLENKGLNVPFYERYVRWLGGVVTGDLGRSFQKNADVGFLLGRALWNTGILAFWVFALMIPLALVTGVIAGIREGKLQDRVVSFLAGDHSDNHFCAGPWLAAGEIEGRGARIHRAPGAYTGALRLRLRRADDPSLRCRGDDVSVCPHGDT
jgi:hypothetical protein